jgi:predicted transcriptional regulator
MGKSLAELAAQIVTAQAALRGMTPEELSGAIKKTFQTLSMLREKEEGSAGAVEAAPAVPAAEQEPEGGAWLEALRADPRKSIRKNKVFCLECGKSFRQLTNGHLKDHGMTAKEYRAKYGFAPRQPLSAQTLTALRKKNAAERNLGETLKKARQMKQAKGKKRA